MIKKSAVIIKRIFIIFFVISFFQVLLISPSTVNSAENSSKKKLPATLVRQAQKALTDLNYRPGPIDGQWGIRTETALIKFQKKNNIPTLGKLDYLTLRKLKLKILR